MEEESHVDEHAHADEEIGDKQCVAYELDAVHQRRELRYVAVHHQTGEERAEDAFQADKLRQRGAEEEHGHYKDKLHHRVAVAAEEPSCQAWDGEKYAHHVYGELANEPQPEQHVALAFIGSHQRGEHHEGKEEAHHRGSHRQRDALLLLYAISRDDGVGDKRV